MRILKYCVLLFIAIVPMTMLAEKNEKSAYALVELCQRIYQHLKKV